LGTYILKKIAYGIIILFGVVTGVFFLQSAVGGNPALLLGGQNATDETIKNIEHDLGLDLPLYQRYFLYLNDLSPISFHSDNPDSRVFMDTAKYDGQALFDMGESTMYFKYPYLGKSYSDKTFVSEKILSKLDDTIVLALGAVMIAFVLGVVFGILSALYKGSFLDNSSFIIAVAGMSAPSFLTGAVISFVFGELWSETMNIPLLPAFTVVFALVIGLILLIVQNGKKSKEDKQKITGSKVMGWAFKGLVIGSGIWFIYVIGYSVFGFESMSWLGAFVEGPGTGLNVTGQLYSINDYTGEEYLTIENLILPAITLGIRPLALVTQLMRSSMLDVLNEDYIRTARAKGLSETKVVLKHGLKNALNPVVTALSGSFASLLAGAVFVERVFNWDGIGNVLLDAIQNSNMPLILGVTIVISTFFVIINLIVDVLYGLLDPRIRLK
jgi:ABC-type dipeptide/oligopeptide/nickel transport system permease component